MPREYQLICVLRGAINHRDMPENSTMAQTSLLHNQTDSLRVNEPCNEPVFLEEPVSVVELYLIIVLLTIMSVIGTAGNALVMYVFAKKRDKQVSTLFILVMAFVDFTTCLIVIPYTIFMEYIKFNIKYDVLCKLYQFLITSNIPFSALVMAAIAIDRYLCICHPFLRALTVARAKVVTAGMAALAVGLGVIVALMYGVYHPVTGPCDTGQSQNGTVINNTDFYTIHASTGLDTATEGLSRTLQPNNAYTYQVAQNTSQHASNVNSNSKDIRYEYTGYCGPNERILTDSFQLFYQKFYTAMFVLCLGIVMVLYTLIYRSVLKRRAQRERQKSKALPLIQNIETTTITRSSPTTMLTVVNGDANLDESPVASAITDESPLHSDLERNGQRKHKKKKQKNSIKKVLKQKTVKKDKIRMANLKTAAMLFVVTVVFIVTFAPAFLMALGILPNNIVVFYMYFANNVANPVIYSFMNKNFREDLRKLFCRRR